MNTNQIVQWLKNLSPTMPLRFVADSRKVQSGDVFFAYPVGKGDGRNYIQQAIDQGARAVVYEETSSFPRRRESSSMRHSAEAEQPAGVDGYLAPARERPVLDSRLRGNDDITEYVEQNFAWNEKWNVPHLAVPNLLWQSGFIVSDYLNHPDTSLFTVAVTGTNGKTSCTQWIARAISLSGVSSAVIGTLGVGVAKNGLMSEFDTTGFTTPDAIQLQQKIASQRERGIGALAIEASSIGLEQGRMNGMHVDVAVLTNLTRDHLDFHGDMANYEAAKTKLFEWPNLKTAVVNLDDAFGMRLAQLCKARGTAVVGYSIEAQGTNNDMPVLKASALKNYHGGTSFHLDSPYGSGVIKTQLIGRFNVSNILAVLATLFVKGIAWREAVHAVEQLTSVSGRMEQLNSSGQVLVIIDYAHTPDALEKTLLNLKEVASERQGKLWCVFGCGGDRDPGKRPQMGKIAELADEIIVTSDNPRSEEPELIMAQIAAGFTPNRIPAPVMEPDRAKAILTAIKHAEKNDVVLLAGKGHETYQEIKGKTVPFSDVDHAHIALANIASKGVGI